MAIVYTTLTEVKTYLGETGSSNDTLLTAITEAAEDAVNVYCLGKSGRSLLSTSYTNEVTDGGFATLTMKHGPITACSRIQVGWDDDWTTVYDSALAPTANDVNVVEIDGRMLRLSAAIGTKVGVLTNVTETMNRGNVRVNYTAGFAATPASVELAIWKIVGKMFATESRTAEGVRRFKTGDIEVEWGSTNSNEPQWLFSKDIEQLLKPYRVYT